MNKYCQSCGMPMKKDPNGGGTNVDGSRNEDYCSLCYQQGQFFQADFTAEDMQKFCMEKITESGVPKIIAWLLTRTIPRLKRWS